MPRYEEPADIDWLPATPRGTLDTLWISSTILSRRHPVYVYLPAESHPGSPLPVLFVMDGGEYLSLARMNAVLDRCIADGRIPAMIGVFVDPRTDPAQSRTSTRMQDYAMSDPFLRVLIEEIRPRLSSRYSITRDPERTGILGASMGGLIATYASLRHPEVFGFCAAQSPSYQIDEGSIFAVAREVSTPALRMYLDTGTLEGAYPLARRMRDLLQEKGIPITYGEYPEGHNWGNWRARLALILRTFTPPRR